MKEIPWQMVGLLISLTAGVAAAQEIRQAPATTVASFPNALPVTSPPAAPIVPPDFQIESTQVKQVEVVEAPEIPGSPPVEGMTTIKIHTVSDPGLADPPLSLAPLPSEDPQMGESGLERESGEQETTIVFLSATVYDHSRTLLRCHSSGGTGEEITVWSNVDFNHFAGFSAFDAKGGGAEPRKYALMLAVGNVTTNGMESGVPAIPKIPDGVPSFVIQTAAPEPTEVTLVGDLHALYRAEGTRMAEAYVAREQACEARKAYLLAHPPKPKDVTVHFWNRGNPSPTVTIGRGEP
jgi:hypothetical protein